jgi:hypothetical protein
VSKPREFWLIKEGGKLPNAHTKRPRPFLDEDIHVIEHSAYAEALELLRECRDMLVFYDSDHSTDLTEKLDKFLGEK